MLERKLTMLKGDFGPTGNEFTFGNEVLLKPQAQTLEELRAATIAQECLDLTGEPCPEDTSWALKPIPTRVPPIPDAADIPNPDAILHYQEALTDPNEPDGYNPYAVIGQLDEKTRGNMVPYPEHLGAGIGIGLAATVAIGLINRNRIDERFPGIKEGIRHKMNMVRNWRFKYGLELSPEKTIKRIRKDIEGRHPEYAAIGPNWTQQDELDLLEVHKGEHGVEMVHMVYRIIASLADVNEHVMPRDVINRLNVEIDHSMVNRSQRWAVSQDRHGAFTLEVAGISYPLRTFAKAIRQQIDDDRKETIQQIASIEPTIIS